MCRTSGDDGGSRKRISRQRRRRVERERTEGNWSISRRRRMHSLSAVDGESESASTSCFLPALPLTSRFLLTYSPSSSLLARLSSIQKGRVSLIQFLRPLSSVLVSNLFFCPLLRLPPCFSLSLSVSRARDREGGRERDAEVAVVCVSRRRLQQFPKATAGYMRESITANGRERVVVDREKGRVRERESQVDDKSAGQRIWVTASKCHRKVPPE